MGGGGKSSDASHLPGNSVYSMLGVFEQLHTFLLQQLSLSCCLCFKKTTSLAIADLKRGGGGGGIFERGGRGGKTGLTFGEL